MGGPHNAIESGSQGHELGGPLSNKLKHLVGAGVKGYPEWRTSRKMIEPSLVVTADGLIKPLLAGGSRSGSDDEDEQAQEDEQGAVLGDEVMSHLQRTCHHKQALFRTFSRLPFVERDATHAHASPSSRAFQHTDGDITDSDDEENKVHVLGVW